LRRSQVLVLGFAIVYSLSFVYSGLLGVSVRSALSSSLLMCGSAATGAAMSAGDLRKAAIVSLWAGTISIAVGLFFPQEFVLGSQQAFDFLPLPLDLGFAQPERRYGFIVPLASSAAMISVALLCAGQWRSRKAGPAVRGHGSSFPAIRTVGLCAIVVSYVLTAQFRYVVFATLAAVILAALIRRRYLLLAAASGAAAAYLFVGSLDSVLLRPFLGRESLIETQSRAMILERSWRVFQESPVLGSGINSNGVLTEALGLAIATPDGAVVSGAHSAHMIVLTEMGAVGLAVWIVMWVAMLRRNWPIEHGSSPPADGTSRYDWNLVPLFIGAYLFVAQFMHGFLFEPWVWCVMAINVNRASTRYALAAARPPTRRLVGQVA
jgi:hypothetical protein